MDSWTPNCDSSGQPGFMLAHLSDPHLSSLRSLTWRELLNKRILGYLSWLKRRRREHHPEILAALQQDLTTRQPDHIAVTGDLTHLGTPAECREARAWLESLGLPSRVSIIPGNHDAYAPAQWTQTMGLWEPYMANERSSASLLRRGGFPFVRCRGPLALIGLSTARPTAPFLASGRLGRRQIEAVEEILVRTGREGRLRVVLLHHPPLPGVIAQRKALDDANALCIVLARAGAELILHGHVHRTLHHTLEVPGGRIPVIGVPSASALSERTDQQAAYHLYQITGSPGLWRLHMEKRQLEPTSCIFQAADEQEIVLPLPCKQVLPIA